MRVFLETSERGCSAAIDRQHRTGDVGGGGGGEVYGRPGHVGVNADLLHLLRSGGSIAELAAAPPGAVLYGQFCDGPAACPAERLDEEASSARRLAGEGVFDLAGFARALPPGCPVSVEIPRNAAIDAGEARAERVKRAVGGVRRVLGES